MILDFFLRITSTYSGGFILIGLRFEAGAFGGRPGLGVPLKLGEGEAEDEGGAALG